VAEAIWNGPHFKYPANQTPFDTSYKGGVEWELRPVVNLISFLFAATHGTLRTSEQANKQTGMTKNKCPKIIIPLTQPKLIL